MIRFPLSITGITQCIILLCLSLAPLTIPKIFDVGINSVIYFLALMLCIMIAWFGVSRVFVKKLVKEETEFFLKYGPLKYKLNTGKMRVCYEKVFIWGGTTNDYYGLVLYRDINKLIGFSFNNRFVLTYEMNEAGYSGV